jgi:regulator of cell morphogenesis and NO signaling
MREVTPDAPVGQLVAERLSRSRVFDRLGIDYCCAGRALLADACANKGLQVREVMRELAVNDLANEETYHLDNATALAQHALVDHIVDVHHSYLRRELPRLSGILEAVVRAHAERHAELLEVRDIFESLKQELELHMLKEENVLFPMVVQLESAATAPMFHCGTVGNPVRVMEHEHADAGDALARLRNLTVRYTAPSDACNSYRALLTGLADLEGDLHRHIHLENEVLFPRAIARENALRSATA